MFEFVVKDTLTRYGHSVGDDLLGFKIDLDAAIGDEQVLVDSELTQTTDPSCLLKAQASVAADIGTIFQIKDALWRVWRAVAYSDFQATSLEGDPQCLSFRFVTAVPKARLCVTGLVHVAGAHYERLVANNR